MQNVLKKSNMHIATGFCGVKHIILYKELISHIVYLPCYT